VRIKHLTVLTKCFFKTLKTVTYRELQSTNEKTRVEEGNIFQPVLVSSLDAVESIIVLAVHRWVLKPKYHMVIEYYHT